MQKIRFSPKSVTVRTVIRDYEQLFQNHLVIYQLSVSTNRESDRAIVLAYEPKRSKSNHPINNYFDDYVETVYIDDRSIPIKITMYLYDKPDKNFIHTESTCDDNDIEEAILTIIEQSIRESSKDISKALYGRFMDKYNSLSIKELSQAAAKDLISLI